MVVAAGVLFSCFTCGAGLYFLAFAVALRKAIYNIGHADLKHRLVQVVFLAAGSEVVAAFLIWRSWPIALGLAVWPFVFMRLTFSNLSTGRS